MFLPITGLHAGQAFPHVGPFVFFFKQKTAYEMLRSLVGSEMCIRDRPTPVDRRVAKLEPVSYTHLTLPTIYSV